MFFGHFVRTYVVVVFDTKISVGNHYVFEGELLKTLTFLGSHGLKDWMQVM